MSFVATGGKNPPDNGRHRRCFGPILHVAHECNRDHQRLLQRRGADVHRRPRRDVAWHQHRYLRRDVEPAGPPAARQHPRYPERPAGLDPVLATTLLPSPISPLSQLITFPQTVHVNAGTKYAIVLNLENAARRRRPGWAHARTGTRRAMRASTWGNGRATPMTSTSTSGHTLLVPPHLKRRMPERLAAFRIQKPRQLRQFRSDRRQEPTGQ